MSTGMSWQIGVDTGGTFTDVVGYHPQTGAWLEKKIWSERGDPGKSLRSALQSLGLRAGDIEIVVYGTTVVTNALIEDKIASVGLLTTKGFRDVLQIARQRRDVLFDLKAVHRGPVIVERGLCCEIDERTEADGRITRSVCRDEAKAVLERLRGRCETLAISFLHSYANCTNENAVAELAREFFRYVSVSNEVSPEAREYERSLATALNASLLPLLTNFVASLTAAGIGAERLRLFHSAGGMVLPSTAAKFPLLLAQSGPAAGVEAASAVARKRQLEHAVTLDMGGTSTDCSLLVDGRAALQMDGSVGRHRVRQPMIAVESVGAGGGSIVRLTDAGLQVGPDSAGSNPGPACYLRGGDLPTITDAAAILGYFGSGAVSDRLLRINREAAHRAFEPISTQLAVSREEAAVGAIRVGNAMAARAIKRITMGRGIDARACSLIAYGGAGPMFACLLAGELGIRHVVVPSRSGAFSALGCLSAEQRLTRQKTVRLKEGDLDQTSIEHVLCELESSVRQELLAGDGAAASVRTDCVALMRYSGQSHEVEVPVLRPVSFHSLAESFRKKHQETYGFWLQEAWECVALRVTARSATSAASQRSIKPLSPVQGLASTVRAYFNGSGWCDTSEYRRNEHPTCVRGPAIVVDEFSTVVIAPNWTARTDDDGHISIECRVD